MSRQEYQTKLQGFSRQDLLKLCRRGGLTAHKAQTNDELIEILWNAFGSKAA
jgi:hypothetical protein